MIWNRSKECMSIDERRNLQSQRLRKIVDYTYHNVPFYRDKMQEKGLMPYDIKDIDDIKLLPYTTKQDLRDNYPFGLQAAPKSEIIRIHASSGTTGNPTIVGYTRRDIAIWSESMARCLTAYGVTRGDIISIGYGYGLFTGGLGVHYGVENLGATALPASTGSTEKHLRLLRDLGATGIACTPSYALHMAEVMHSMGIDPSQLQLRIGAFGGEPWTENMRHEIEAALNLKAFNLYGLSEIMGPCVSFECCSQSGSHINEDHYFPEIIDTDTLEPIGENKLGELVFTTLTKEGMPLLRYRTRDLTTLYHDDCPCGRTLVKMDRLSGRSDDMLIIRGINVFPSQIESVILSIPECSANYLIIVDRVRNMDSLTVQVEMRPESFASGFDTFEPIFKLEKTLAAQLKSVLSITAKVEVKQPGTLERTDHKAKRVIDNRTIR